jgi:hydroxymethylbilane synthase
LAIVIRADDTQVAELCRSIDDCESRTTTTAERAFLAALEGGCQTPIGAYSVLAGEPLVLTLTGMVSNLDGSRLLRHTASGPGTDAAALGHRLAEMMRADGCQEIFDEVFGRSLPAQEE